MGLMCLLAVHLLHCRSCLCLPPGNGLSLLCCYSIIMAATVSMGRPYARSICTSFLCVWNRRPWRSRQIRFFARIPSRIRRIFKICDVVDLFQRPFWFFLSIFSILGSMRLWSRALYILATMDIRVILQ